MRARIVPRLLLPAIVLVGSSACGGHSGSSASCATALSKLAPVTQKGEQVATGGGIDVDAANAAFTPTCVTRVSEGTFMLRVHNTGLVIHDVVVPDQHIDVDVRPGHTVTIPIKIGPAPVVYMCRYHRALGMVGVLIPATT